MNRLHRAIAIAALLPTGPLFAAAHDTAISVEVQSAAEGPTGTVTLAPTASGQMHVRIELQNVPEGAHGVHIHETGDCSAADYTSAGGHLAGDAQHGVMVEGGPHPGDLPNAHAGPDGTVMVEYFNDRLTMDMLSDGDGAAFIVHSAPDDYESQPSGAAGDRIACAVLVAPE